MVNWISSWAHGIIIAVIIGTIIEMILPKNGVSKYVKIIIGLYVLFIIITPVISNFSKSNIDLEVFNIEEYEVENNEFNGSEVESQNTIKKIYEQNLIQDIQNKLKLKGYLCEYIVLNISDDNTYLLNGINIKIQSKINKEEKEAVTIIDNVESIKVSLGGSDNKESDKSSIITEKEKKELQEFIFTTYEINEQNININ